MVLVAGAASRAGEVSRAAATAAVARWPAAWAEEAGSGAAVEAEAEAPAVARRRIRTPSRRRGYNIQPVVLGSSSIDKQEPTNLKETPWFCNVTG